MGAFNLVTLFLHPVFVQSVTVSANPPSVASGGTSAIAAQALTNAGTPVSDGTTINFSVTQGKGGVEPFAQTTNGIATAQFNAPTLAAGAGNETDRITASVGGQPVPPPSTTVTVIAPAAPTPTPTPTPALAINPPTASSIVGICATFTFTITGGTPPYTTSSSNINRAFNDNGTGGGTAGNCVRNGGELGIWSGSSITVTVPAQPICTAPNTPPRCTTPGGTATAGTVDLNVSDSAGGTAKATITIQ